jgi:hypothetical protein
MQKSTVFLLSLLGAALLTCGARTASAAPLSAVTPGVADFYSAASHALPSVSAQSEATSFAVGENDEFAPVASDMTYFASNSLSSAANLPGEPVDAPEPPSLVLLGTGVLCIAGLGRRLVL